MNARGVGRILPRALLALCASAFILACGCGSSGGSGGQAAADESASKPAASPDAAGSSGATGAPYTQPDSIAVPQTSGGGISHRTRICFWHPGDDRRRDGDERRRVRR